MAKKTPKSLKAKQRPYNIESFFPEDMTLSGSELDIIGEAIEHLYSEDSHQDRMDVGNKPLDDMTVLLVPTRNTDALKRAIEYLKLVEKTSQISRTAEIRFLDLSRDNQQWSSVAIPHPFRQLFKPIGPLDYASNGDLPAGWQEIPVSAIYKLSVELSAATNISEFSSFLLRGFGEDDIIIEPYASDKKVALLRILRKYYCHKVDGLYHGYLGLRAAKYISEHLQEAWPLPIDPNISKAFLDDLDRFGFQWQLRGNTRSVSDFRSNPFLAQSEDNQQVVLDEDGEEHHQGKSRIDEAADDIGAGITFDA